jgi:hypothetical protein
MDIPVQAYVALGAIFAALIAGFFSYLNLIISKESKVSEFRQNWINELRSEIGEFAASVNALALLNRKIAKDMTSTEFLQASLPAVDKIDQSYTSITLRINKNEENKEHKQINEKFLSTLEEIRAAYKGGNHESARDLLVPLRDSAQPLLRYEWKRVKEGEKAYKHGKQIALVVLMSGILGGAYIIYVISINTQPSATTKPVQDKPAPH